MKRKNKNSRPAREPKGALPNPLLHESLQGRHYAIKRFTIVPEITLYTSNGMEERAFDAQVSLRVFESQFDKTLPEIMQAQGLKMESGRPARKVEE